MADSLDNFGIRLDLDISGLQAEMIKAENELRKFQSELKKTTDTAEITKLTASIGNLDDKIAHLNQRMGGMSKPTADATQSLVNLSRIAQDAPYGFMGIANNLNPMLESFQQLSAKSNGAGGALKAMAAGLTGPAGIGVALGVVSSLFVAFGDDIMNFINKVGEFEKAQKSMRDGFADNSKAVGETIAKDEALISVINDVSQSTEARNAALKKLKDEYKGNIELQKTDIEDGKLLEEILKKISAALLRKAEIEAIVKVIGEEYSKQVRLQISTSEEQVKNLSILTKTWDGLKSVFLAGGVGSAVSKAYDSLTKTDGLAKSKKDIAEFGQAIEKLQVLLQEKTGESFKLGDYETTDNKGPKKDKKEKLTEVQKIITDLQEAERSLDYQLSKGMLNELPQGKDKKSYYSEKIDAISEAIRKLAGLTSTEAKTALSSLEKELSSTKVESLGKILDRRAVDVEGVMSERKGNPEALRRGIINAEGAGDKNKYEQDQKRIKQLDKDLEKAQRQAESFAKTLSNELTNGIMGMWDALERGDSVFEAFGNFLKDMVKQLAAAVIQAILFKSIMSALGYGGGAVGGGGDMGSGVTTMLGGLMGWAADGGIVSTPTMALVGEGGQSEAIMPLNKLGNMMNSTFNAGAMSGQGATNGGQFVLKGNDLVLALNRSNYSLNLRRGA